MVDFSSLHESAQRAPLLATLSLGFVLGLKHALDADHLVAVSTIVGRHRSFWRSSVIGAYWGLGHTTSLLAAAIAVIGLRRTIPARAAQGLEVMVGLMLVVLGIDLLRRVARGEVGVHSHAHIGKRPFIIGMVHGLAGSAALTIVVLSTIRSPGASLYYVLIFGLGSIVGMLVMSAAVGLPFALAARRGEALGGLVQTVAAFGSIGFGIWYAYRTLFVEGLWMQI